ncbi:MAG: hypothetical protein HY966_06670 [Ignavibacteriales bacterium]|nr:hypothetical protein [Ignavibacteriales bacterium]
MNQSQRTSFGLYETCRILLPGFYFATLVAFFSAAFRFNDTPPPIPFPAFIVFLFITIVSGLTMYAKETSKRRRAFVENQPSTYLQNKARLLSQSEALGNDEARRLYFYILNNHVPPAFHDKIFFFGTVYHIMILIRRTSFWFGMFGLAGIFVRLASAIPLPDQRALIALTIIVWAIYFLNVRYNKADRKMQENYQDQIFWLEMNDDIVRDILKKRRTYHKQNPL